MSGSDCLPALRGQLLRMLPSLGVQGQAHQRGALRLLAQNVSPQLLPTRAVAKVTSGNTCGAYF